MRGSAGMAGPHDSRRPGWALRIIEMGTHAELLAKGGQYRKLYELQFADEEEDPQISQIPQMA